VELTPKPGSRAAAAELSRAFRLELADEKLRERVSRENRGLREFLTLKALNFQPQSRAQEDAGLTPQQEKELNELIAQIETEIKTETGKVSKADPLGITSTWEDKYGAGDTQKNR
jgi:predicted transglutaminase-like cysteine proteinase